MSEFLSENFQYMVVKFSIYLNMSVFFMGLIIKNKTKNDITNGTSLTIERTNQKKNAIEIPLSNSLRHSCGGLKPWFTGAQTDPSVPKQ